jgi:hypothetical protein
MLALVSLWIARLALQMLQCELCNIVFSFYWLSFYYWWKTKTTGTAPAFDAGQRSEAEIFKMLRK